MTTQYLTRSMGHMAGKAHHAPTKAGVVRLSAADIAAGRRRVAQRNTGPVRLDPAEVERGKRILAAQELSKWWIRQYGDPFKVGPRR